jgi:hypothetical protein
MKLTDLYDSKLSGLSETLVETIIKEAPHTRLVKSSVPFCFSMLVGSFIDFGFENLPISQQEKMEIGKAFIGSGVRLGDTLYKARYLRTGVSVIEPIETTNVPEIRLPDNWLSAVLVLDDDDTPKWVGSLVRSDQVTIDDNDYISFPSGKLKKSNH